MVTYKVYKLKKNPNHCHRGTCIIVRHISLGVTYNTFVICLCVNHVVACTTCIIIYLENVQLLILQVQYMYFVSFWKFCHSIELRVENYRFLTPSTRGKSYVCIAHVQLNACLNKISLWNYPSLIKERLKNLDMCCYFIKSCF